MFKALSAFLIWMLGFFGGLGPLCCKDVNPRITSVLNLFAGGIFFAGSILHLLPDAVNNQALACLSSEKENKLWAYFFYGVGFLLILFIEMFAHELEGKSSEHEHGQHSSAHEHIPLVINTVKSSSSIAEECAGGSVSHAHIHGVLGDINAITLIVFISLSFHSLMEGVAIGSQMKIAWDIALAVIAHKSLAAFALGLEFVSHRVPRPKFLCFITLFSLMTPIGIWIGSLTVTGTSEDGKDSLASGICTALSGGTFLFVAVMETIPQELQNRQDQLCKSIALCLGFGFFGLLANWA